VCFSSSAAFTIIAPFVDADQERNESMISGAPGFLDRIIDRP